MRTTGRVRPLFNALLAAGVVACQSAHGVRVNPDGFGQALVFPYYTMRSTQSGNAYVTALTLTNVTTRPKVVKVRFFEGKAGAEVFDFNLFLNVYDVWTAGILSGANGPGIFSADNSCTSPKLSNRALTPSRFRNASYAADPLGDDLDRTYEGYFEVLEMGVIDPASALANAVTHSSDSSGFNSSKPSCVNLPTGDTVPTGLTRPSGGINGNASLLNINEGTFYTFDAIALSQWSDKVQWSAPGNPHPNLSDVSPAVSVVLDHAEDGDRMFITRWDSGRDAVSALFMVERVINDFTVESSIKAQTDWVMSMPTKRFYVSPTSVARPFQSVLGAGGSCDVVGHNSGTPAAWLAPDVYDRGAQGIGDVGCFLGPCPDGTLCAASNIAAFPARTGGGFGVLQSANARKVLLYDGWVNGYAELDLTRIGLHQLPAPMGATTIVSTIGKGTQSGMTVTYVGLPIVGFAAQAYSNGSLPLGTGTVLSNYGGTFSHKFTRRIDVAP